MRGVTQIYYYFDCHSKECVVVLRVKCQFSEYLVSNRGAGEAGGFVGGAGEDGGLIGGAGEDGGLIGGAGEAGDLWRSWRSWWTCWRDW